MNINKFKPMEILNKKAWAPISILMNEIKRKKKFKKCKIFLNR